MPPKKKSAKKVAASAKKPEEKSTAKKRDELLDKLEKGGLIGNIEKKIDFIKTGSWVLNRLIGDGTQMGNPGGIPRGYITELYGDEATGKTTLALHMAKEAQKEGGVVIYADFEKSLRVQQQYIKNIGIEYGYPKFVHLVPDDLQQGVRAIGECLYTLKPSLIIIDSVTAMAPKETIEAEADEMTQMGRHARMVGSFIQWISKRLEKKNCAIVFINQMRANIKTSQYDPGPREITTGGNALKFFASVRIRLKSTHNKEEISGVSPITGLSEKKYMSQEVKVIIDKNKLDVPFRSGPIWIQFGQGIDNIMSLITLGVNKRIIKKNQAYLKWDDPNGQLSFNIAGKAALKKYLSENPQTMDALYPYLMPTKDEAEMDTIQMELEEKGIDNLSQDEKEQLREIRKIKGASTLDLDFTAEDAADLAELDAEMG